VKSGRRLLRRSRQDKRKLSSRQEEAAAAGIRRATRKMKKGVERKRRNQDGTADKGATVESPTRETRETNKWEERGARGR